MLAVAHTPVFSRHKRHLSVIDKLTSRRTKRRKCGDSMSSWQKQRARTEVVMVCS